MAAPKIVTATASRLVPQPPDLIRWVKREGGFVHPNLKTSDNSSLGLGIVSAHETIPTGSDLIALPGHIPLRFEPEPQSTINKLAGRVPEELWAMKLGLRLLQERSKKVGSFWWPYISNLPETFNIPIFFSGDEIKNIQYMPLLHQVNKRCRFLFEFDKEIKSFLKDVKLEDHPFEGKDVDSSSLGWAMSAVSSRAFRLHGHNNEIPMMLPLIDMCNHSFHPNARIVQEQDTQVSNMLVKVVAESQIEPNSPILLNYGYLSNDMFLLDYGFVIPENPYDNVELKYDGMLLEAASMAAGVSSPSFSSPENWQLDILSKLNLAGDGAVPKVTLGGPNLMDPRLLASLRVLLSKDKDVALNTNLNTLMSLSTEAPLGVDTEISALRTIVSLCVISLEYFPTKVMQDESILKEGPSSSMELVVQFRMQKKLMIIDVMKKLSKRIRMLSEKKKTTA